MSQTRALITGINGQDGSYLAELLLALGYNVAGTIHPAHVEEPAKLANIAAITDRVELIPARLEISSDVESAVNLTRPDECYHLAAQSTVSYDPLQESATLSLNILGTHTLFSAIRALVPQCRVFFAASSEVFGNAAESPQNETTPLSPRSFYGLTKTAGLQMARLFRDLHDVYVSVGILYNHESPRRAPQFVTRKITMAVASIAAGSSEKLTLGNLDSRRDWGHAKDFVRAMRLALRPTVPDDFVIATGVTHSVREFCDVAFGCVGLRYQDHVVSDPAFFRPAETVATVGDYSRARNVLGWTPAATFEDLVREMVESDCLALGINAGRSYQQA
ncbi:MAG TPA: GDP-mannose 4,6-dehydratase [Bryobacteraceae bacterium]|nr:GDP-mannose 4,6-dehydratase [Bryobacteraceae bacterium]